ncbi:hypothetical protein [Spiroplasma endosymbiont of Megaselia nigra]|uniref:hypothetical protein n=1 Tax=Spiroplasma endosymbiont of Megaselia nigra TaxID=2478537 RepID=UPI000F89AD26|nr:hypothetical protein [Spiroplasma endosymbiont of Megaselia nigra]RUO86253.1 hypothetical protein D9R21_04170 [Spiroplasma endosymbiont of Megaselia nigra]
MAIEKTKDKNLNQKENQLLNKKINSYTLEKLIRHSNKGKVEPANKMIAEYYARRDKEMQAAKVRREQANRGGIYNFSLAKYDNFFKTVNTTNKELTKQYNLHTANLKSEKVLPIDRFSPQYLAKQNKIGIKKENDNRPVIDLFDENNNEKQPAIIVYDPVKGIYVMQEPKLGRKETSSSETSLAGKLKQQTISRKSGNISKKKAIEENISNDITKDHTIISNRRRGYSDTNSIDPSKKLNVLSQIQEQTDETEIFKQKLEVNKPLSKNSQKEKSEQKFSKKQFLHDLEANQKKENINLPNYYQTNYSPKKGFSSFCSKVLDFFKITKWINKSKRWNK